MKRAGRPDGLDERIDRALARWPDPLEPRTRLEWDEGAERIVAALDVPTSTQHVSDEDLLRAPLPLASEEVQSSAPVTTPDMRTREAGMGQTSSRDRKSLQDLAKLAGKPQTPARGTRVGSADDWKEDSGLINLAELQAAPVSAEVPVPAVPPSVQKPPSSLSGGGVGMSTLRSAAPPPSEPKRPETKRGAGFWLSAMGLVAAAAAAGGVFFGMRQGAPSAVTTAAQPPAPQAAPAPAIVPEPIASSSVGAPAPTGAAAPSDRALDPSQLPMAAATSTPRPLGMGGATPKANPPQAAPETTAKVEPAGVPAASATGSASLQDLMRQAAGGGATSAPAPTVAASDAPRVAESGSVPLRPSLGAVQGALGTALPGARACLGPDDPISHAMVTFGSDGTVQSVSVTGGAAGKPAEACIKAALMKAHVPPFAQPTFTAPATVRPQ
jgi:hypothetical protein